MKTCPLCKQEKDQSCFNKRERSKDGFQPYCIDCNREKSKKHYENNKPAYRLKNRKARKEKREFIASLKQGLHCEICSEKEVCCLDFHHLGDKDFNIGDATKYNYPLAKIKEEIAKCICVCSNCHRKLHAGVINYCPLV